MGPECLHAYGSERRKAVVYLVPRCAERGAKVEEVLRKMVRYETKDRISAEVVQLISEGWLWLAAGRVCC